jgi:hypothetical protein
MDSRTHRRLGLAAAAVVHVVAPGCAIHYYDPKTQTEHVWGFGHMAIKVSTPNEGVRAIVRGVDTVGVGIGSLPGHGYIAAGWQSVRRMEIVEESTAVRLEWPTADFFSVRVGSEFPGFITDEARQEAPR